jgi:hypothetical protein
MDIPSFDNLYFLIIYEIYHELFFIYGKIFPIANHADWGSSKTYYLVKEIQGEPILTSS